MHTRGYLCLFATAALACSLASAGQWTKTYTVSGKPDLRVQTNDGAVTVTAWDQKRIEAVVITKGWKIGTEVQIHEHQTGDHVDIEAKVPSHLDLFNFDQTSLRIELKVPRDTNAEVRSGDGSVEVSGMQGDMRISTGDGSIHAAGVSGNLEARTGDGSVRADGRFDALNVHTGDGSVNVSVANGSRVTTAWRIETGDGSVKVQLPSQLAADLDVMTGDGGLDVDLPLTMKTANTGEDRKSLHGKLNGGGQPVYVRTGDGSVHIGRL